MSSPPGASSARSSIRCCSRSARSPGIRLYGIDYKDDPASARRFLGRYGNPYARVGADSSGRVAIDFGVYGVPETYVVTGEGKIAYRHVGPLTEQAVKDRILPLLQAAGWKTSGSSGAPCRRRRRQRSD